MHNETAPLRNGVDPAPPPAGPTIEERRRIVQEAIDALAPVVAGDGGMLSLVAVDGDQVTVRLAGTCGACELASLTLLGLRARLVPQLGRAVRVVPEGTPIDVVPEGVPIGA